MASMNSPESLKLDPAAAAGLIAKGAQTGTQAALAGAVGGGGVVGTSPIDIARAAGRAKATVLQTGWAAAAAVCTSRREAGETGGVTALSEMESQNAVRLSEVVTAGTIAT